MTLPITLKAWYVYPKGMEDYTDYAITYANDYWIMHHKIRGRALAKSNSLYYLIDKVKIINLRAVRAPEHDIVRFNNLSIRRRDISRVAKAINRTHKVEL